ncbi:MAG: dockerin type I repeat-containing protein [candidate division Zixibacteria bacterium]|nr:dockerin type I repeat-containing protein [candidate division Zixibacteria bacterium]
MRKLLMLVLLVFWSLPAFAQDTLLWSRTYGGSSRDEGYSVQQTTDGGYIVVGMTSSFGAGGEDVYLVKTDSLGDTLWSRTYGGSDWDEGYSVQQTTDGEYIVAGFTYSFGAGYSDVYLIKTNSTGDTLWSRTYGGSNYDRGYSVQQTTDGGYIVAGLTESFGADGEDAYLIKTNSTGDTLWTRTYGGGGSGHDEGWFVQQTTDGGYIVAGWTSSFGAGGEDACLIKTNSTGDTLWTRTYGGSSNEHAYSVQQTTDGGYIVVGWTRSFGGNNDVYLIKTNSAGDTLWTRTYGGSYSDLGFSVQQTTGGYIVAGFTYSFGASYDVYLIKTNSTGDTLWSRTYGGSGSELGFSIQQTTDGGYIVVGRASSFGAGGRDVMLTKLDPFGNSCIGEFVSSTVMSVSCTVTSPATQVGSPSTEVTSPTWTVTSPATAVTTVCIWQRGDANGDGDINVTDIVYLINYLFNETSPPDPLWLGDANCDGKVDVVDIVYLINYLFGEGPPPGC